jgi:hypothetical protein
MDQPQTRQSCDLLMNLQVIQDTANYGSLGGGGYVQ